MIYKKFDNPHIKLWNNELEKLFKFKSLPSNISSNDGSLNIPKNGKKVENEENLGERHLKDIMNQKILLPIEKVVEN